MKGINLHLKQSQRFAVVLCYLQSPQQFDRQMITEILPLTSDTVDANIQNFISEPMLASRLTADNSLLVDLLHENKQQPDAIAA
ncbi:hypothetical protein KR52_11355 [Synechococcus sp. KORDI-52]|uniref:hypothetical protein n=1 Tax=Synechococcus sp. KORDI-52 TaxID=585425 RepID=UPI0004E05B37|nr:hypothetical protein [Synechococcus sp. KORDI-52]AII49731.1 hypothetical protein KR52_11355 [Synechococcus sp. KORDI-52]